MDDPTARTNRRYDLDRLRVFACYLLFLFHVAMVFNPAPFYHIRNDEVSPVMLVLAGFISLWHMPLFFLLAGWSAFASLQQRGARTFFRERVFKLLIPLLAISAIFGPAIKYLELRSGLDASYLGLRVSPAMQESFRAAIGVDLPLAVPFDETFLQFWPTFFTQPERASWSHLWFIAYLFVFSLLYLPLFARLARRARSRAAMSPLWVYLPILPLALIQITLRPHFPGLQTLWNDWANFAYYSTFLIAGFALARQPALERAVQREWKRALGLGLGTSLVLLGSVLGLVDSEPLLLAGSAVASWSFVVAILGFAHLRLAHPTRRLPYLTESAFPIYLLHQPAIVLLGFGIIELPLGLAPKFFLLLGASIAATLAVYHFAVRRVPLLRFLHGMKSLPNDRAAAQRISRAATSEV